MGDLRRILEGYVHWQKRIFPSLSFVEFIEKVEKLGSKRSVQVGGWMDGWMSGWLAACMHACLLHYSVHHCVAWMVSVAWQQAGCAGGWVHVCIRVVYIISPPGSMYKVTSYAATLSFRLASDNRLCDMCRSRSCGKRGRQVSTWVHQLVHE